MTSAALPGRGIPQAPQNVQARQARRVLLLSLSVTALLYVIPGGGLIGYPLVLLSTFVHEVAHGLTAVLVGGRFLDLRVFADGSGAALTATNGGALQRAAVAAGGLIGPAIAAGVGFTLGRRPRTARVTLLVGSLLLMVMAVLWVRSLVGWFVVIGLIAVSLGVGLAIRQDHWSQLWLIFLSVQLGLSVFSRGEYLFASSATTGAGFGPSDSSAISDALFLPYWFWGGVCGLFSLAVLAYGAWLFLRTALSSQDG
ncbi:MAG: M50 family metallopeptidase [Euzebya sp.]